MKRYYIAVITIILGIVCTISTVFAANPVDTITNSAQEKINKTEQDLQKKIVEHAAEGNLTTEHLSEEVNATIQEKKEELKEQGKEYIDKNLNLTEEEIQQKLKEEVQKQPGFGIILSLAGLLAAVYILRR